MRIRSFTALATAVAMTAAPLAPALAAQPSAAALSITGQRAATPASETNALGGGGVGIYAALILAGIAAILIIDGTSGDPDSN